MVCHESSVDREPSAIFSRVRLSETSPSPVIFRTPFSLPVEKVCSLMSDRKIPTTFGRFSFAASNSCAFGSDVLLFSIIGDLMTRPAFRGDIKFYF